MKKIISLNIIAIIGIALTSAACNGSVYEKLLEKYTGADGQEAPAVTVPGGSTGSTTDTVVVQSVLPIDNTTIKIVFDEAVVKSEAENISNYSVDNGLGILAASRDNANTAIVTLTTSSQSSGTLYTVTVSSVSGVDGSNLDSVKNTGTFTGIAPIDTTAPSVVNVVSTSSTRVDVFFGESVDNATAGTSSNYTFYSDSGCTTVALGTNPTAASRDGANLSLVHLTTNAQSSTTYYIKVSTVQDLAGNAMTASSCLAFNGTAADTNAPTVVSVSYTNSTTVKVVFSEPVDPTTAGTASNYSVSPSIGGSANPSSATHDSLNPDTVYLTYAAAMTGGTTYTVTVTGVKDTSNNTIAGSNSGSFFYPSSDTTAPYVVSAVAQTNAKVLVTFSETVDQTTAETTSNYTISGLTISSAVRQTNTAQVLLTTTSQSSISYTLQVANVEDVAGNIIGNPSSATFTGDALPAASSAYALNNTKIRVIFSEDLNNDAGITTIANYSVYETATPANTLAISSAVFVTGSANVVELAVAAQTAGMDYTVEVVNSGATKIKDLNSNVVDSTANKAVFAGDGLPQLTSVTTLSPTSISLSFSEAVQTAGAEVTANYSIGSCSSNTLTISSAKLSGSSTVTLTVSGGTTNGDTCTLTVGNTGSPKVMDLNSNLLDTGANSKAFSYDGSTDTTAPTVANAISTSNTAVEVTFSESVDITNDANGAANTSNYSLTGSLTISNAVCSTTSGISKCTLTTTSQALASYTVTVSNVKDSAGNSIGSPNSAGFTGTPPSDTTPPTVLLAQAINDTQVKVYFSEAVELTTAQTTTNYSITGSLTVSSAVRQADPSIVLLTTSQMTANTTYTATVNNVKDLAGNAISGSNTADFTGIDTSFPYVTGASSSSDTIVDITFSEPVNQTDAEAASNYTIVEDGTGTPLTVSSASRDGTNLNIVHLTTASQTAVTYRIKAVNIRDLSNNRIIDNNSTNIALFTGTAPAGSNPTVASVAAKSSTTACVTFSEAMLAGAVTGTAECSNATACSSIYSIPGLTISSAVSYTASCATAQAGTNSDTFLITTAEQSEGTSYTLTVTSGSVKDSTDGTAIGSTGNTGTFTGDGRPLVSTVVSSANCTDVNLTFDQTMGAGVTTAANYAIVACTNNGGGCTGASQTASTVALSSGTTYTVTFGTSMSGSGDVYTIQIDNVQDSTGNTIVAATQKTFNGCGGADTVPPVLNTASAPDDTHVLLTFSEPVDQTTAETSTNYSLSGGLTVSAAVRQTNNSQVLLTTSVQGGGNYSVTVTNVKDLANNVINANGIDNVQPFTGAGSGGTPQNFDAGPVFSNPFNDNVPSGQIFVFNKKLYVGPSSSEGSIFEMTYDMGTSTTITLDADGTTGAPLTTFKNLPTTGGKGWTAIGIDYFYAACLGASPSTLTGTACTGAGGTEATFVGAYINTGGNYDSFWMSTDAGSTRTFSEISGLETGGNAFRSMSMFVFKDQMYVALQDQGGGAIKFSRVCVNPSGCANGDTYQLVTPLKGSNLNHMGAKGTFSNGQNGNLIAIDTMWEYDNDGAGGNESQLYIANGGSDVNIGTRTGSTQTDGGILRTNLTYSTAASPPPTCGNAAACDGYWEDVTPTSLKWLRYMSIALPQNAVGDGICDNTGDDWDCLIPKNKVTPAIKAIPSMRTAPNGDLYMIRNACSSTTVQTILSTVNQTCPSGSEVPQIWMLPKGTTGSPKGAADWQLVAERTATDGRSDMSDKAECGTAPNKCDTENTHITMLEFNGSFMYVGYDNTTYGLNVWRVDFNNAASQGGAIPSGTAPLESDFSLVSTFGLTGTNKSVPDTRIFSSATVNDGGVDYLVISTGDGTNPVNIFRTKNN